MEIKILEEFVCLFETCNYQETAAMMNLSQSALSKHIHKLEEELNISLFDRSTRNVQLNEYSRLLYPYAKQIVSIYNDAVSFVSQASRNEEKEVIIAYSPVLGQYGLVDILAEFFRPRNQSEQSSMRTIESYQSFSLLKSGRADFAFLEESEIEENNNFNKLIFKTDHLAAVLRPDHPCAQQQTVTLDDLKSEHFILHASATSRPHEETRNFLELCAREHFEPNVVMESQFSSTMVRYVLAGRGVAILNRLHIPSEAFDKCAVIDIFPVTRSYIYLMYRRKISNPIAREFLHFVIEKAASS